MSQKFHSLSIQTTPPRPPLAQRRSTNILFQTTDPNLWFRKCSQWSPAGPQKETGSGREIWGSQHSIRTLRLGCFLTHGCELEARRSCTVMRESITHGGTQTRDVSSAFIYLPSGLYSGKQHSQRVATKIKRTD